jgi:hypothetical protein
MVGVEFKMRAEGLGIQAPDAGNSDIILAKGLRLSRDAISFGSRWVEPKTILALPA